MADLDLSVILTAHAEEYLLRPTMRAIIEAIDVVGRAGLTAELVMVADNPTAATLDELNLWVDRVSFDARVVRAAHGEPGASRNTGVAAARGRYVALCDGDDLFTSDLLLAALRILGSRGGRTVVHPHHVLSFGDRTILWHVRGSDDPGVSYRDLLESNLWPSCSITTRELLQEFPYPELPPGSGYGPEDYVWNIRTASAGISHVTAPDSFHFYRTRDSGGVNNANSRAILPPFDLDELRRGFPSTDVPYLGSEPSVRQGARRIAARAYHRFKPLARRVPFDARRRMYRRLREVAGRPMWDFTALPEEVRSRVQRVAELEPAVSWSLLDLEKDRVPVWAPPTDEYAEVLEYVWDNLRGQTDILVLAPWVGVGGADLVTINYARVLIGQAELHERVALLTTADAERTLPELLPAGLRHRQLPSAFRRFHKHRRQQLIAQALLLIRPKLILSIGCFDFTQALRAYAPQICARSAVYVSFFAFDRIGTGHYPTNPITDDAQRRYLALLAGIVTDNSVTAGLLRDALGVPHDLVKVHRQPALPEPPTLLEVTEGSAAYDDEQFDAAHPFEIVWPHRLDREKRPDSLVRIAERLREAGVPARLHVHGSAILHGEDPDPRHRLRQLGVVIHGPYTGGLPALPIKTYHCMLLTSESEGLPLSIVQAMLLGLPVVASAVGGVVDIIEDRRSGLLTGGPDDIEGFVRSIEELIASRSLRRELIRRGHERAVDQHSPDAFESVVLTELAEHWK